MYIKGRLGNQNGNFGYCHCVQLLPQEDIRYATENSTGE